MESNYSADGPVLDMFVVIRYLYHYCRGPSVVQKGEDSKKKRGTGREAGKTRAVSGRRSRECPH